MGDVILYRDEITGETHSAGSIGGLFGQFPGARKSQERDAVGDSFIKKKEKEKIKLSANFKISQEKKDYAQQLKANRAYADATRVEFQLRQQYQRAEAEAQRLQRELQTATAVRIALEMKCDFLVF